MPSLPDKFGQRALPKRQQGAVAPVSVSEMPNMDAYKRIAAEVDKRKIETLKVLTLTEKQWSIIKTPCRKRLVLGANRSGKTSIIMMDLAMLVTGVHPVHQYPENYEGRVYCVGKDVNALAKVFYKKLRRKGEFRIIRDAETSEWRSYNPCFDEAREHESKQAPALIPDRMVPQETELFRSKKAKIPKTFTVVNDKGQKWELDFFTAEGDPHAIRGVNLDAIYFSEEIEDAEWYHESMARLLDRHGFFVWDAAQQDASDALSELDDMADREAGKENPSVWKIRLSLYDNPYMPREEIEFLEKSLITQEERDIRIHGLPMTKKIRMFPEFSPERHVLERKHLSGGAVPNDWCRYVALDPGIETAALVFCAVPPPEWAYHPTLILAYDEIYVSGETIEAIVRRFASKCEGQSFHAFLIDENQGRKRSSANGKTEMSQYSEAMHKLRVTSAMTKNGFWPGFDELVAGTQMFRTALAPTENGRPRFMVLEGTCPNLTNEIRMMKRDKKKNKQHQIVYLDTPAPNQADHAWDCCRYIVSQNPRWYKPKDPVLPMNWAQREMERYRKAKHGERSCVTLGPRPRKEHSHG